MPKPISNNIRLLTKIVKVELQDLWIGDLLKIKSSGKIGKFEGVNKEGKARIKVGDKILLASSKNVEVVSEKELASSLNKHKEEFEERTRRDKVVFGPNYYSEANSIDLHIETLNPSLQTNRAERIFDFQMKAFESYLRKSIKEKKSSIRVIHGKGTGVLKAEIESILKFHPKVFQTFPIHDGGGTEILFSQG